MLADILLVLLKVVLSLAWAVHIFVAGGLLWVFLESSKPQKGSRWIYIAMLALIAITAGIGAAIWLFVGIWPAVVGLVVGLVGAVIIVTDMRRS